MADARVSQFAVETLSVNAVPGQVTQLAAELLNTVPNAPLQVTQVAAEIVFANVNDANVTQVVCELIVIPRTTSGRTPCPSTFPVE